MLAETRAADNTHGNLREENTMSCHAVPLGRLFGLLLMTLCAATPALAQGNWPTRPVKLILPYAPGGATDFIGRPWADKLQQAFR